MKLRTAGLELIITMLLVKSLLQCNGAIADELIPKKKFVLNNLLNADYKKYIQKINSLKKRGKGKLFSA